MDVFQRPDWNDFDPFISIGGDMTGRKPWGTTRRVDKKGASFPKIFVYGIPDCELTMLVLREAVNEKFGEVKDIKIDLGGLVYI